ncbi:MAG: hypothetical protein JETCAE03_34670 [Ignavibacteriaceae bacterium]|jgi:hypothetical protein|nr:MAG: hypothetical protein JETCAE03_34670 [Ignavibacteriaceae bacterium]
MIREYEIRRGDMIYSQRIPDDEPWSETLKRTGLKVLKVGYRIGDEFEVEIFEIQGERMIKMHDLKLTPEAIAKIMK